jgi:polyphenol oxidase
VIVRGRTPLPADWLVPDWAASGAGAVMTTRHGGVSHAPFDSFNVRAGIGDAADAVAQNQRLLQQAIGAQPVYLSQVHGAAVVRLGTVDLAPGALQQAADASVTTEPGIACAVQVADCLPVLFAAPRGRAGAEASGEQSGSGGVVVAAGAADAVGAVAAVGAAHAGWRGLALGVLEATLAEVCAAARCEPAEVQVWLGACIGPARFEVGADVLEAFGASPRDAAPRHFAPKSSGKWWADLPGLARERLLRAGVREISGGRWCTATDASRFFSFRRDGVTGRMVAAVWIDVDRR